MCKYISLIFFALFFTNLLLAQAILNPHGLEQQDRNPEYRYIVDFYRQIAFQHKSVYMTTAGPTDTYDSLQVVYYSADGSFDVTKWKQQKKMVILIYNGIHPGEPDGIVASMQLLWDITKGKVVIPKNVVLAIIPVFNISGAKNLRTATRANQNGPTLTGFRGNAQNLDLNRDFMKVDARETASLIKLFLSLSPDILIDNHVSNGADYQHVMTLLSTQHSKLGGVMGPYLNNTFEPALYKEMKTRGYDLVPYVNVWGRTPDDGWQGFLETPRFLSGYAALHNTFSFVAETHMLKPFAQRVDATYKLMQSIIAYTAANSKQISKIRQQQKEYIKKSISLPINWTIDTSRHTIVEYKGYKSGTRLSEVSKQPIMYYDSNLPFTKQVPFYNYFIQSTTVDVPTAYIIPQGWYKVVRRLRDNGVVLQTFEQDTTINLVVTKIASFKTSNYPYEGHYLHSNVQGKTVTKPIRLQKGDYYISTTQFARRYIVESLELAAPDGFFAWGFFDGILQQKEHFSDYAFESLAADILHKDEELAAMLASKCAQDTSFAHDARAQLDYVFQNCDYHEPEHMRYPVYKLK